MKLLVRQKDNAVTTNELLIKEITVSKPHNIQELGFRHAEQAKIIQNIQDAYLPLQCKLLFGLGDLCPTCGNIVKAVELC